MAKVTLSARNAALEARLVVATEVYRTQKARIAELEAALNTRGVKPAAVPTTRQFSKGGQLFERVSTGFHQYTIRPVQAA